MRSTTCRARCGRYCTPALFSVKRPEARIGAVGGGHAPSEHVLVEALPGRTALRRVLVEDLLPDSTKPTATSDAPQP
ncbi:hypothetical protein [Dactylosporangium sp. CA-233914]|uniref:hypothetical protein n=1 Tax=Dactylosporangium sp. CA-233914 TaxID=3239934 RepID=UPI003D91FC98